jgi:hypothetical protein
MAKFDLLDKLLKTNNGYIKTSQAIESNISKTYFMKYVKEKKLIKVAHGLYMTSDTWKDDLYVIQIRYPKVVFSHETSAFLLGLSNREPFEISVTLKTGKGSSRLIKDGVKVYKIKNDLLEIGLIEVQTYLGNKVRGYNMERTLCDLVRNRNIIEVQEVQTYIQEYFKSKDKNIPQLMRYAKLFSIEKVIRQYSEVLL